MGTLRQIISVEVKKELLRRQEKNKRYSMRSYARQLKLEPSLLSKIMLEKVTPTTKTLNKLLASLNIEASEKEALLSRFLDKKRDVSAKYKIGKTNFGRVNEEQEWPFQTWTDLVVYSTMGLSESTTIEELNSRLDLGDSEISKSLLHLKSQGLVDRKGNQYFLKIKQFADSVPVKSNEIKKQIQKKFLEKAYESMDEVSLENRLNGTLTFTVDPKILPKVKQKIASFMAEINGFCLAQSAQVSEVYNLSLALYPLKEK